MGVEKDKSNKKKKSSGKEGSPVNEAMGELDKIVAKTVEESEEMLKRVQAREKKKEGSQSTSTPPNGEKALLVETQVPKETQLCPSQRSLWSEKGTCDARSVVSKCGNNMGEKCYVCRPLWSQLTTPMGTPLHSERCLGNEELLKVRPLWSEVGGSSIVSGCSLKGHICYSDSTTQKSPVPPVWSHLETRTVDSGQSTTGYSSSSVPESAGFSVNPYDSDHGSVQSEAALIKRDTVVGGVKGPLRPLRSDISTISGSCCTEGLCVDKDFSDLAVRQPTSRGSDNYRFLPFTPCGNSEPETYYPGKENTVFLKQGEKCYKSLDDRTLLFVREVPNNGQVVHETRIDPRTRLLAMREQERVEREKREQMEKEEKEKRDHTERDEREKREQYEREEREKREQYEREEREKREQYEREEKEKREQYEREEKEKREQRNEEERKNKESTIRQRKQEEIRRREMKEMEMEQRKREEREEQKRLRRSKEKIEAMVNARMSPKEVADVEPEKKKEVISFGFDTSIMINDWKFPGKKHMLKISAVCPDFKVGNVYVNDRPLDPEQKKRYPESMDQ